MRFMNDYDIARAEDKFADHPVLGPAVQTLVNLRDAANANSDGWAYWPAPARAANKLMELIENGDRFDYEREDATPDKLATALRPIKAFRTRHGIDFEIVSELPLRLF